MSLLTHICSHLRGTGENRWKVFFHLKPGSSSAVTYTLQYIVQWTCLSISQYNLQYIQYISQYIQYISQYIVQYILQYIWQYNLQYNLQYISQYNLQYIHYILQDTALSGFSRGSTLRVRTASLPAPLRARCAEPSSSDDDAMLLFLSRWPHRSMAAPGLHRVPPPLLLSSATRPLRYTRRTPPVCPAGSEELLSGLWRRVFRRWVHQNFWFKSDRAAAEVPLPGLKLKFAPCVSPG